MKYVTAAYIAFLVGLEVLADQYIRPWDLVPMGDKIAHFILIGILCLLANITLKGTCLQNRLFRVQIGSLVVAGLATIAEVAQIFAATRTFSITDLAFSYAGVACFSPFAAVLLRRFRFLRETDG